jgi:hypothetical protein
MNSPELLREFTNELLRRGLPLDYSRRAAEELSDHYRDLVEELQVAGMDEVAAVEAASERLGNPKSLVKKTVSAYQRRHWCGRWPVVTFVLSAPFAVYLGWCSVVLAGVTISRDELGRFPAMNEDGVISPREWWTFQSLWFFSCIVLSLLLATTYCRLANRARLNSYWPIMSCVVLGLLQGMFCFELHKEQCRGTISLIFRDLAIFLDPWQAFQFLLPLAVAGLLIWRNGYQTRRDLLLET